MRILSVETESSERTMQTVSLRFFPLSKTESPRKSSSSSILVWDKATTELSSLAASSTISRFGRSFFLRMAVAKSSPDLNTYSVKSCNRINLKNTYLASFFGPILILWSNLMKWRAATFIRENSPAPAPLCSKYTSITIQSRSLHTGRDKALLNGADDRSKCYHLIWSLIFQKW